MRRLLLPAALLLTACAAPGGGDAPAPEALPRRDAITRSLQFTETWEIRFGDELAGYLVEVLPVPEGLHDDRPFKPGTALVEDLDFQLLGFLSPRGTTYRFDDAGEAKAVGFGSRNMSIAAFFGRNGAPRLVAATSPGTR
jgi:hypothetical protein